MKIGIISDSIQDNKAGIGFYTKNIISSNIENIKFTLIDYRENVEGNTLILKNVLKDKIFGTHFWYLTLPFRLRNSNFDLIHNPSQIPTFFKFKQKYIITIHDLTPLKFNKAHKFGKGILYKILYKRTLESADKILTISESTKKDILEIFPNIKKEKIIVTYLAAENKFKEKLSKSKLESCKKKYSLPEKFFLYVGTIEPRKNLVGLIEAFSEIKNDEGYKLVIVGKKGWKFKQIYEKINEKKLSSKIIFTGYVPDEDLPKIYNLAKFFTYVSLYEGFGIPILESMSAGCPVITSNISSMPEVAGDAAIIVDPYDKKSISNAIKSLIKEPKLRKKLSMKSKKHSKRFSWKYTQREIYKVYENLINQK